MTDELERGMAPEDEPSSEGAEAFDDVPPEGWEGAETSGGSAEAPDEGEEAFREPEEDLPVPSPFGAMLGRATSPSPAPNRLSPGIPSDLGEGSDLQAPSEGPSPGFESVERVQVSKGSGGAGLEVVPAQRALEQGLRFLAIGGAPSQHFAKDGLGAELLRSVGGNLQGIPPGNATRRDPHDAAKRTPEVAVEPPTVVEKRPILPPRFSLDEVDDLLPPAPPSPRPQPVPSLAIPDRPEGTAQGYENRNEAIISSGFVSGPADARPSEFLPERELQADGPEAKAGLRFHPPGAAPAPAAAAAAGSVAPPPRPAEGRPPATQRRGFGVGHLVAVGLAASAVTGLVALSRGEKPAQGDPVAVYALGAREQGVTYLDSQIAQLERDLGAKETAMQVAIRALGASPTPEQLSAVEVLGRDRNRLTITLEALRRRRERMVEGGIHG